MGIPLNEYRKRHKLGFIWSGGDNGVCFFSKGNRPFLVCLTSDVVRSVSTCPECKSINKGEITIELIGFFNGKVTLMHDHVHPDADLNAIVKKNVDEKLNPFRAKNYKDLEVWLWNFFLQLNPIRDASWHKFRKGQKGSKSSRAVEQMFWIVNYFPRIYRTYYAGFYTSYLLGRNYLMYR